MRTASKRAKAKRRAQRRAKRAQRRAKRAQRRAKRAQRRAKRPAVMSRLMREKPLTMSVDDLGVITDSSRNSAYAAIASGTYPAVRQGRLIKVLVGPTMAILNGMRAPGSVADDPAAEASANCDEKKPVAKLKPAEPGHPDSAAKKRRAANGLVARKKRAAKSKPVARKGEVAPTAVPS